MNNVSSLLRPCTQWVETFFEKRPVTANLVSVVTTVALGALVGLVAAFVAATPIGLTVGIGVAAGLLLGIAIVAQLRLKSNDKILPASTLNKEIEESQEIEETQEINEIIEQDKGMETEAFGKEQWLKLYGLEISDQPELSDDLIEILYKPCPADPTKKVGDTHMLTLIPRGLTFENLQRLAEKHIPRNGFSRWCDAKVLSQLDSPNEQSYWVLMKKNVKAEIFVDEKGFCSKGQGGILVNLTSTDINYTHPTVIEAITLIIAGLPTSQASLLASRNHFLRCKEVVDGERVIVGRAMQEGFIISSSRRAV